MTDNIIVDTATRIFADLCEPNTINDAEKGTWPKALWDALEESGLPLTWVPDTLGGAGAEMTDGFAVLRAAGRAAAPVPLAETLLAGWLLAQGNIEAPAGPMAIAPIYEDGHINLAGNKLQGRARHVPYARNAQHIAVLAFSGDTPTVALVAADAVAISQGTSLAGEPRDTITFDGATAVAVGAAHGLGTLGIVQIGATARAQQMAGALEHILDQSVQWSLDRVQFGRAIAKFQAVQHNLATLAGEVAAAGAAADAAAEAIAVHGIGSDVTSAEVAIAKLRVGEAAGAGAAIAHQVHGAMGFTYEHSLHHATRRLWAWREEFGNEAQWATRLGHMVAARGADALWPFLTQGS
ncbi:MAG TPA: acyl-CoA dehydrogenase family protein [Stellaceae bacterium]|jgi:acyl-CoA dehydrogenase|nr:acyl-CoA dehydrogenase family protein [Stellaceae bacterium]